jgi:hypothetical protein
MFKYFGKEKEMANYDKTRSKDKLKQYIEDEITKFFGSTLDYAEVAVDGKERFKMFRSRILKLGNDVIRELKKELDQHYDVHFVSTFEEVIKLNTKR